MFEVAMPVLLCLVDSMAGSIYMQKFLRPKYHEKIVLFLWMVLYFIGQNLTWGRLNSFYFLNDFVKVTLCTVFILLLQEFLYLKDRSKQLFVAVSFVAGKEIIKYIIVVFYSILYLIWGELTFCFIERKVMITKEEIENWSFAFSGIICLVNILLYAGIMTVYLSVISRKFIRKDYQLKSHENAFLILPSLSTLCVSITHKMMIMSVENGMTITMFEKVPATMFWVPLICFLLLGVIISSVILFQKLVQLGEEERKRIILENHMSQMQREIEEIQDIYADMRGIRHDMRSHLNSIAAVISRTSGEDREELNGYIGSMEKAVSRLDFAYMTGNPITDVIIHQKKQEAEKQHISFDADFTYPDKQQIDVYDIGIVLNNALENAIEASSKLAGEKSISLRSYMKGNLFFIEVENDFSGELVMNSETGLPISSKEDGKLHGVGMENIHRCAKKYKGDIDITIRDMGDRKCFNLTIMMYEKNFTPQIR